MTGETDPTLTGDKKPAGLLLKDGTIVSLPEFTLDEARDLVELARDAGEWIGGEIDPAEVETIVLVADQDVTVLNDREAQLRGAAGAQGLTLTLNPEYGYNLVDALTGTPVSALSGDPVHDGSIDWVNLYLRRGGWEAERTVLGQVRDAAESRGLELEPHRDPNGRWLWTARDRNGSAVIDGVSYPELRDRLDLGF